MNGGYFGESKPPNGPRFSGRRRFAPDPETPWWPECYKRTRNGNSEAGPSASAGYTAGCDRSSMPENRTPVLAWAGQSEIPAEARVPMPNALPTLRASRCPRRGDSDGALEFKLGSLLAHNGAYERLCPEAATQQGHCESKEAVLSTTRSSKARRTGQALGSECLPRGRQPASRPYNGWALTGWQQR